MPESSTYGVSADRGSLRHDLRVIFGEADQMTTADILARLHELDDSPWHDLKGKPLDARGLSWRLRQYGIKPRTIRTGYATPKGYRREDLLDAWARYLPEEKKETQ